CAFARYYLAEIELVAGDAAAAIRYAHEAIATDSDQPGFQCVYRARLANAHLLAGDTTAALAEASTAIQLMATHGRPEEGEAVVRLAYARALHANGQTADARAAIAEAEQRVRDEASRIGDA